MKKALAILLLLCIVASLAVIFISTPTSASEVLRLDKEKSYVLNLETGSKQTYEDFMNSDQFEGTRLEFNIYVSKISNPILDDYVLELRTNMDNPEWKFGDDIYHSANVIVWKEKAEHERMAPKVILSGDVPKPMGKGEVYVTLTVGTTEDGKSLETVIQKLEPPMKFFSTPASTPTPMPAPPKGCLLEYSPSSDTVIEEGTEIEVFCKSWNCGGSWCAIEARVFNAETGEILAANWESCDSEDRNCVVVARERITVNHQLRLGFQASHWDYEHSDWIRDETKYVTIKLRSKPEPTIKGNVYNTETGSPVEGATVICEDIFYLPPVHMPPLLRVTDHQGYFEFEDLRTGSYRITVTHKNYETANKTVSLTYTKPHSYLKFELQPTKKPNFKITDLMVSPSEVKIGEKVTIIADVKNIGDTAGTYMVKIRVNNAVTHYEEVTLSPGETKSVKCYYTPQSEGYYEVEAGGLRRDFNAIRLTPSPVTLTPTPIPGFEGILAIAGLVAVAYLLRRR